MKILFTNESALIKYGLAEGFKQLGHTVKVIMGEHERLWRIPVDEQARRLEKAINEFNPDIAFTEGYPGCSPSTISGVFNKHNIPHLYWAIEDPVSPGISDQYVPGASIIFTTTEERVPVYRSKGKPSEVLLFGCNPEFHKRVSPKKEYQHDIILVAANYSSRYEESAWFVMPLVEQGYDIKIYGIWWNDTTRPVNLNNYTHVYGGILPYEELPAAYSSAKIILGMNCDDTSNTQTSMRPYEALACSGGLYLAHYTKAQAKIFGDYLWQAKNTKETLEIVNTLINMPEAERIKIASRAQKFVYDNHSYKQRAQQIVDAVRRYL
jgi:spore maturation protein CgeB